MIRLTLKHLIKLTFVFYAILVMASCVTQKDLEYLRDKKEALEIFEDAEIPDYKLKPLDELYITVKSLDDPSTNVMQQQGGGGQASTNLTPFAASLMSHLVNSEGYIQLPIVGMFKVSDRTIIEVAQMIQDSLEGILNHPNVTVKLVNRFVSVLGEVQRPGHFTYTQEKLTIYDAIGLAGDILDYGDRHEVVLTRNENGENKRYILDLGKPEILASEQYYIRPNDMIYVKPMKKKFWDLRTFPYGFSIALVSTAIIVYNAVN